MNVGQKVRVVKYGHLVWESKSGTTSDYTTYWENEKSRWIDVKSELVGRIGEISETVCLGGQNKYRIEALDSGKQWYNEDQLELI